MKKLLPLLLFCLGCTHHSKEISVAVSLTNNNHSIRISGFDKAIIDDIGRDTTSDIWQSLLPVYKMPADTDMKDFQQPQPGRYAVKGSQVIFTPDTAFKHGQAYFVRCFDYSGIKSAWQIVSEKKQVGALKHRDLLFSY
jgi:hypothetical protein